MGSFNKQFTEYSKDNFISAEELQKLSRGYRTIYQTGSVKNGNVGTETRLSDEKGFWKKFKKNYNKKGGESLGIAGVAGRADRDKLINAYNNPKYGPPVAEKAKGEKEDNKFKSSIELLSEDDLEGTLYKPERRDTSAIDKRYGLGKIQAEVDEIKANAAPSPTLNFKKGLLKGIVSKAVNLTGLDKATTKANDKLSKLMDKASKFDTDMTFDMIPEQVQRQKERELEQKKESRAIKKLGPSGPNYTPIENEDSAFKGVLPMSRQNINFGAPSTDKAKGVSLTKGQAEKNFNPIKAVKQFAKEKEKNFNPIKAVKQFAEENFNPIKAVKQFAKEKEKNFNPIKAVKQFAKETKKSKKK